MSDFEMLIDRATVFDDIDDEVNKEEETGYLLPVSVICTNPQFGATSLLLAISEGVGKRGSVLFLSLEDSEKQIRDKMDKMGMTDEFIVIDDNPLPDVDYIMQKAAQIPNLQLIVMDYFQLFFGKVHGLFTINEKTGVPVLVSSRVGRSANDNPHCLTSFADIVFTLQMSSFMINQMKAIRKFCLNRPHDCFRTVGTAICSDIQNESEVVEYDNNGIVRKFELMWNPETLRFTDRNPVKRSTDENMNREGGG